MAYDRSFYAAQHKKNTPLRRQSEHKNSRTSGTAEVGRSSPQVVNINYYIDRYSH